MAVHFTQPVLIELNTSEVREGLRALGYEVVYPKECPENFGWATGAGHAVMLQPKSFFHWSAGAPNSKRINCGDHIKLFLALAALREDTDKGQWFVDHENKWLLNQRDTIREFVDRAAIAGYSCETLRKATPAELVEHFKAAGQ